MRAVWICMVTMAALGGCDSNTTPVKATVLSIDRTCTFIAKDAAKTETEEPCSTTPEFREFADKGKPNGNRLVGREVMHLSWTAPADGSMHYGDLKFTGRDDEFYTVNADDQIAIRIKKDDPSMFRRA